MEGSNRILAEELITLNDGVVRRCKFDFNAQVLIGDVYLQSGKEKFGAAMENPLGSLRLQLWAGMASDVNRRLKDPNWTILRVGDLLDGMDIAELLGKVARLKASASAGPEKDTSGKKSKKKRGLKPPKNGRE